MRTATISTRISTAITPPVTPMTTAVAIGEDIVIGEGVAIGEDVVMEVGREEDTDGPGGFVIYGNNNWF